MCLCIFLVWAHLFFSLGEIVWIQLEALGAAASDAQVQWTFRDAARKHAASRNWEAVELVLKLMWIRHDNGWHHGYYLLLEVIAKKYYFVCC